jgi:hypothetical protein
MDILITAFMSGCGYGLVVRDGFELLIGFRDAIDMDLMGNLAQRALDKCRQDIY